MTYAIVPNIYRDINLTFTKNFIQILKQNSIEFKIPKSLSERLPGCEVFDKSLVGVDAIITIGGDGTILHALSNTDLPILGINLGNLGFLTELESSDIDQICDYLVREDYFIEKRMVIEVKVDGEVYTALNDIVFARETGADTFGKIIKINIYANGTILDSIIADGLIISTPTGSTAYSLSAGGPIVSPNVQAILITPICPHALHNRPILTSDNDALTVEILPNESKAIVSVDGKNVKSISRKNTARFTIQKSQKTAKFIRFNDYDFYKRLFAKMNKWK